MNMISERTMDIYLVHGETRVPARLYVRFRPDGVGVYLGLHSDVVEAEAGELVDGAGGCAARQVTLGHFLDALAEGIFPGLPEGTAIELDHVVELFSGSSRKGTVPLRETMTGARIGEEPVVVFTLRFELDGHPIEVTEAEDIYYAFRRVAEQIQGGCRICGFCAFAKIKNYGGDDWRHGLYCFRDDPEAHEKLKHRNDARLWASQSWSNVDAFHSCPSFKPADWYKRILEAQGEGKPDADEDGKDWCDS